MGEVTSLTKTYALLQETVTHLRGEANNEGGSDDFLQCVEEQGGRDWRGCRGLGPFLDEVERGLKELALGDLKNIPHREDPIGVLYQLVERDLQKE